MPATAVQPTTSVLERLRQLILDDDLRPGMKLPPERVLAARLGAGRPAVREAIKSLSSVDVLESRRGDGTYLRSAAGFGNERLVDPTTSDLVELLEVRKMFEPRAAALATARATRAQLARIEKELRLQERNRGNLSAFATHDYRFHHAIICAVGNRVLIGITKMLEEILLQSRELTVRTTTSIDLVLDQHRTIFRAVQLGQADLAERAMLEHLQTMGIDLIRDVKR